MDYEPVDNVSNFVNNCCVGFFNVDKKLNKTIVQPVDNVSSKGET